HVAAVRREALGAGAQRCQEIREPCHRTPFRMKKPGPALRRNPARAPCRKRCAAYPSALARFARKATPRGPRTDLRPPQNLAFVDGGYQKNHNLRPCDGDVSVAERSECPPEGASASASSHPDPDAPEDRLPLPGGRHSRGRPAPRSPRQDP